MPERNSGILFSVDDEDGAGKGFDLVEIVKFVNREKRNGCDYPECGHK